MRPMHAKNFALFYKWHRCYGKLFVILFFQLTKKACWVAFICCLALLCLKAWSLRRAIISMDLLTGYRRVHVPVPYDKLNSSSDDSPVDHAAYEVQPNRPPDLSRLPKLAGLNWPHLPLLNTSIPEATQGLKMFEIPLSRGHRATLMKLLEIFQQTMIEHRLNDQWFLIAGTLIGSVRHHDIVPWDDDMDVTIHVKYRPIMKAAFQRLAPEVEFHKWGPYDKINFKPRSRSLGISPDAIGSYKLRLATSVWQTRA